MISKIRNRHLFFSDLVLLALASYMSFVLRLERFDLREYWPGSLVFTLTVLLITPAIFYAMRLYAHYWQYASVEDVFGLCFGIMLATGLASGLTFVGFQTFFDRLAIPRAVPLIFLLLAIGVTAGPRTVLRLAASHHRRFPRQRSLQPVLVVGAGNAGAMIVREFQRNPQLGAKVIGFVDDHPRKLHARIYGVPVLGNRYQLANIVAQFHIEQVIIAMPSAPGKTIRELMHLCDQSGIKPQIIPAIYELLDGKVSVNKLRDVQIEDLLRRAPVQTDISAVRGLLQGRRVLVTGGGGSIGSELCRQVLNCRPSELIILGHGENSVFQIHNELSHVLAKFKAEHRADSDEAPNCTLHPVIADIRFYDRILAVFEKYQPEIVFQAAAHKHVPLMEYNPVEAITNNVLGTMHVLQASQVVGVERFVMISSDKAVRPTSIMGASKRVAELLVQQAAQASGRPYLAVRFGNVLGSRGSVVLTFKQQIAAGGPVTITHPEMERFFMTIPEAVQLVLQAAVLGTGGEVFMLDMGKPIKIMDLARDMIKLSGLEVDRDIEIVCTGTRPGEKLYEELFIPGEVYKSTNHEKLFIAINDSNVVPANFDQWIDVLTISARRDDEAAIIGILCNLIPQHRFAHQVESDLYVRNGSPVLDPPLRTKTVSA